MKILYSPPAVEVNHVRVERNFLNTVLNGNSSSTPGSTDADMDMEDADPDLWG